jgi:hypothetical protein
MTTLEGNLGARLLRSGVAPREARQGCGRSEEESVDRPIPQRPSFDETSFRRQEIT